MVFRNSYPVMPGLDPGIQGGKNRSRWPLDRRVKPGDDKIENCCGYFFASAASMSAEAFFRASSGPIWPTRASCR